MGGMVGGDELVYNEGACAIIENIVNEPSLGAMWMVGTGTMMGVFAGAAGDGLDLKRPNPDEATEYLFRPFSLILER